MGSECQWETWKTALTQRSGRLSAYGAKLLVLVLGTVTLVMTLGLSALAASVLIALREARPLTWPADVTVALGAGVLVRCMWAYVGAALAVVLRSVSMPIGLGVVWLLAVQNLLAAITAPALEWVATARRGCPDRTSAPWLPRSAPGIEELASSGHCARTVSSVLGRRWL